MIAAAFLVSANFLPAVGDQMPLPPLALPQQATRLVGKDTRPACPRELSGHEYQHVLERGDVDISGAAWVELPSVSTAF